MKRIAIANPDVAPYGRAAVAALRTKGLYDAVRSKIVRGENISQTAQLADSGNADVSIVAHSLAIGPALAASGTYVEIPPAPSPIEQASSSSALQEQGPARRFLTYRGEATPRRRCGGSGSPQLSQLPLDAPPQHTG